MITHGTHLEPAIPEIKGLDVSAALWRIEGDRKLYLLILQSFIDTQSNMSNLIEDALNLGQIELARQHVHAIRGMSGTMGATDLEGLASDLEEAILQKKPAETVRSAFISFAAELDRLLVDLAVHLSAAPKISESEIKGIST